MNVTEIFITHRLTFRKGTELMTYASGRSFSGLVLAISGSIEYRLSNGEKLWVREGDLLYLPEKSGYEAYTYDSEFEHITLNFEFRRSQDSTVPEKISELLFGNTPIAVHPDTADVKRLFERAVASREGRYEGGELICRACICEIMYMLVAELCGRTENAAAKSVASAKSFIEENFRSEIHTSVLSSLCNMSETNLRRRFKEAYGVTPGEYVQNLRLSTSKELLLTRLYRISEVAYMSGYPDANYFSRLFRQKIGMSPEDFMNSK